ncbi:MAG: shikimate kinase, partial [Anaerolineales bacterium]
MHIFLYGLSGSGNSTVGKLLAERLNKPFLDLDAQSELDTQPIAQIMAEQGETAFRNLESRTLQEAVSGADKVISLGGGALLREENRLLAETSGKVVLLEADLTTLLARLSQDDTPRPLLAGDLQTKLEALIDDRKAHYDSFSLHVNASRLPEEVNWQI